MCSQFCQAWSRSVIGLGPGEQSNFRVLPSLEKSSLRLHCATAHAVILTDSVERVTVIFPLNDHWNFSRPVIYSGPDAIVYLDCVVSMTKL